MDGLPVLSACRWYLRGDSHHLGFYVLATFFPLSVDGAVYPLLLTIYVIFFVFDFLSIKIFGLQAWYIASFFKSGTAICPFNSTLSQAKYDLHHP